jgi:phosphonate transport system substrate-binding protein
MLASFGGGLAALAVPGARAESQAGVCTFGVFPYVPALKIGDLFAPMAADLTNALGTEIQLRTKETFEKFAAELAAGTYDIVLLHPFLYVDGHTQQGYTAIARLDEQLRAVILSRRPGSIAKLADLRGETLALPPQLAGVSYLIRLAMLDEGLEPGTDLQLRYYQTKVSCLHAVATEQAVGCVVPSFIGRQLEAIDKMHLERIWQSEPITSLVVAVHPRLPQAARDRLQQRMLAWDDTDDGRQLLADLSWPRLTPAADEDYETIRLLADRIRAYPSG